MPAEPHSQRDYTIISIIIQLPYRQKFSKGKNFEMSSLSVIQNFHFRKNVSSTLKNKSILKKLHSQKYLNILFSKWLKIFEISEIKVF